MQGNAWQWTADCYQESYNAAPQDGSAWAPEGCNRRVVRGGSWYDGPQVLRAARRYGDAARNGSIGFRLARTLQ
jgi:formylglycine-generating enzyme required for sulfatase activity